MNYKDGTPISLHGLTPEQALRTLLAVKPDAAEDGEAAAQEAVGVDDEAPA
jgi:hypothetical protein